jgi:hypothetical protein
LQCS